LTIKLAVLGEDGMYETGSILAEERKKQGKSVEDIEDATNIRKDFIEAIEAGRFDDLPDHYATFFIKDYADYLRIDSDPILKNLQVNGKENTDVPMVILSSFEKKGRGRARHTLGIAFLVFLIFFVVGILNWNWADRPLKETTRRAEREKKSSINSESKAKNDEGAIKPQSVSQTAETPNVVLIKLWVSAEPSWAQIKADEQTIYEGILVPGSYREWSGRNKIEIKIGNAGAVRVQVNERELGVLGSFGQVITRTFTPQTRM